jgi:hypothetical protein
MAAETPDFTLQTESLELRKPLPIASIRQHVRRKHTRYVDVLVCRKTGADASQAPTRRGDMRLQNLAGACLEPKIHRANDGGGNPALAVLVTVTHRRDAVGKFRLTQRAQLLWPVRSLHHPGLDVHRLAGR